MQLDEKKREMLQQKIAQYEARRDQFLAEANVAQGAAMALKELLNESESQEDAIQRVK